MDMWTFYLWLIYHKTVVYYYVHHLRKEMLSERKKKKPNVDTIGETENYPVESC